jgi:hypothetical protein
MIPGEVSGAARVAHRGRREDLPKLMPKPETPSWRAQRLRFQWVCLVFGFSVGGLGLASWRRIASLWAE